MRVSKLTQALLIAMTGLSLSVSAQVESETDEEAAERSSAELDRIQVTARRREERLEDVPISISAFSGADLQDFGAQDITYLKQVVPNSTIEVSRGTSTTLTAFIRGVGQQDPVAGFEAGVGIYLDDVILNRPQGAVLDIYDVERIEVLRGPQGTLYGRNTIGGAVKYVTQRLGREPALTAEGRLGSFSQQDLIVKGQVPLGTSAAIGVGLATFNRNGYGTNLFLDEDNYDKDVLAFRGSVEWEPLSNLFFRLSGDYFEDDSNPVAGHRLIPGLFSGAPVLDHVFNSRAGMTGRNEADGWGITLLGEWEIDPAWALKSITSYRDDEHWQLIDFEALPAADVDVPVVYENEQFSQEIQLTFTGDRIAGTAGAYYLDASAFNAFDVLLGLTGDLIGLPGLNAFTLGDVDTETWAVFADVSFDLGAYFGMATGLEFSVGGRYTEDERSAQVLRQTLIGGNSEFFGGAGFPIATTSNFEGSETFTKFTPRFSLAWQPTPDHNLYASFSQGFKGGGFDPRGATTAAPDLDGDGMVSEEEIFEFMKFEPEEVDTWEIGSKSRFFNDRLSVNLALFHSDYTDIQVPGSIGVDTTGDGVNDTFAGVTTNAGEATVQGIELEIGAILAYDLLAAGDQLNLAGAFGYIDADYDEFITAVTDPVTGETSLQDVSDQRVFQNTPSRTAHVNLRYDAPLSILGTPGRFSVIGAWSYRSKTNQFEIPSQFLDQSGYSLYDLNFVWRRFDNRYEVGLHGRNLFNKEYQVSGHQFVTPNGSASTLGLEGVANAFFGPPRTITLVGRVNF